MNRLFLTSSLGLLLLSLPHLAGAEARFSPPLRGAPQPPEIVLKKDSALESSRLSAAAVIYSIGDPTPEEQLYLEFINRARANPVAESLIFATTRDPLVLREYSAAKVDLSLMQTQFASIFPMPPLAMNPQLITSARRHSQDMLLNVFQEHVGSDGSTFDQRMVDAGYDIAAGGENIYAYSKSVFHGHTGFEVDWGDGPGGMQNPPGHRRNIHSSLFREVGIGLVFGTNSAPDKISVGPQLVTQDFGTVQRDVPLITGVAYFDLNGNRFYDPGEGIGGLRVTVNGRSTEGLTARSGGYAVPVSTNGDYQVTFSGGGFTPSTTLVTVKDRKNVKLDFVPVYSAPIVSGSLTPDVDRTNKYSVSPVPGAAEAQWRAIQLQAAALEGAENGTNNISIVQSSAYTVIQGQKTLSGNFAFQLATPAIEDASIDGSQYLNLSPLYFIESNAVLSFASRLGWAKSDQHAQVQVSTDEGRSWEVIYNQDGSNGAGETNFVQRSVSLKPWAGKLVQVRFVYAFSTGRYIVHTDGDTGDGWLLDDIQLNNADESRSEMLTALIEENFDFIPDRAADYLLQARVKTGHDFLDWGPPLTVRAGVPTGTPVFSISSFSCSGGQVQMAIFQNSGANPESWSVESSETLNGPWRTESESVTNIARQRYLLVFSEDSKENRFYRVRAN